VGYLKAGYREYRTYYDLSGGYYPPNQAWIQPWDPENSIDRGEVWVEAGLRLEELPQLTFRYAHQFRDGYKDSTSWGDYRINIGQPGRPRSAVSCQFLGHR